MAKYVEAIKENAANAVKEPGCREFNVLVMPNRPAATTANMVADRNPRAMSVIAINSKGYS